MLYSRAIPERLNRVISKNSLIKSSRRSAFSKEMARYLLRSSGEISFSSLSRERYPITEVSGVLRLSLIHIFMQGEIIALEGQNGSGKSSLLKLICGEDISYTGRFYRAAGLKISYVPQDVSFLRGSLTQYAHSCGVDITLFKALLRKLDFSREQFEKDMRSYSCFLYTSRCV